MIREKLQADRELLKNNFFLIENSLKECEEIGIKEEYSVEEFGKLKLYVVTTVEA